MPKPRLSQDDLDLIKSGYLMRLTANDTCQVLNKTRSIPVSPSTVSYQYSKLQAQGLHRCTPLEVINYREALKRIYETANRNSTTATQQDPTTLGKPVEDFV